MRKVLHTILTKGKFLKTDTGKRDWIVVDRQDDKVVLGCITSYKTISEKEAMNWNILDEEDIHLPKNKIS